MRLWTQGGFVADRYVKAETLDQAPVGGAALVPLALWRAERAALEAKCASVAVEIAATKEAPAALADLTDRPMIALAYSKFGDGRAFSYARLLRARLGYSGEIRAVGDVLWDEIGYMIRCGFDSFAIQNEPTLRALDSGRKPGVPLAYQPGLASETHVGKRPWTRALAL